MLNNKMKLKLMKSQMKMFKSKKMMKLITMMDLNYRNPL